MQSIPSHPESLEAVVPADGATELDMDIFFVINDFISRDQFESMSQRSTVLGSKISDCVVRDATTDDIRIAPSDAYAFDTFSELFKPYLATKFKTDLYAHSATTDSSLPPSNMWANVAKKVTLTAHRNLKVQYTNGIVFVTLQTSRFLPLLDETQRKALSARVIDAASSALGAGATYTLDGTLPETATASLLGSGLLADTDTLWLVSVVVCFFYWVSLLHVFCFLFCSSDDGTKAVFVAAAGNAAVWTNRHEHLSVVVSAEGGDVAAVSAELEAVCLCITYFVSH